MVGRATNTWGPLSHQHITTKKRGQPTRFTEEYAADIAETMLDDIPDDELSAALVDENDSLVNTDGTMKKKVWVSFKEPLAHLKTRRCEYHERRF